MNRLDAVDLIEGIQHRVVLREDEHVPLRERSNQIVAKCLKLGRPLTLSTEIVDHHETAAVDVLAEVGNFLFCQSHLSRFGDIAERILEYFRAAQFNDAI